MKKYILAVLSSALLSASFGQSWGLTGNSGTNPPTNFLGTKDSKALVFKTNNTERMRINPTGNGNVGIGVTNPVQRLDVNGNINLGKGFSLFMENHRVLRVDSIQAGVFLGNSAGAKNAAAYNTATGYYAFASNTSGNYNTANGAFALYLNTTGVGNVAMGVNALINNTTGSHNTATGGAALYYNSNGEKNVASGEYALFSNTSGSSNSAVGNEAMYYNTTGSKNTAFGEGALWRNSTGYSNTAVGYYALSGNYGAGGNTALGYQAGFYIPHGYYNTFIGSNANAITDGLYNTVALGSDAKVTAPNQVRIGNSYTTSIGGYANWSNISDGRVKKNVKENVPGLTFINKLKPVTYNLDLDAADKIVSRPSTKDKEGKLLLYQPSQIEMNARSAKQQIVYTGFVAQDVEEAAKELNYDFSGVDVAKSDKDLYALRYSDFVAPLVKAVQELSKKNDEKEAKINEQDTKIDNLQKQINELKSLLSGDENKATINDKRQTINISSASLEQNIPNPFNRTTILNYVLPQQFSSAKIIIADKSGKALKQINVSGSGKGSLHIDAATLSSGTYQYSFYVDGRLIETKQMVLTK